MQVTVSRLSPVNVELKVLLPKERVARALTKAYNDLGKVAQIKGFRKGKVPLPILKQYFGARVTGDVTQSLVDETLNVAIAEQKLFPVTTPQIAPDTVPSGDGDWTYTAKLEVRPEVAEVVLEGIALERQVYTVDDSDVDHQIQHIREKNATSRVPDPMRPVQSGDLVTIDFELSVDGQKKDDFAARNRTVEAGKGRLLKEIDAALTGMNIGDSKDVTVKFPADHQREELRDKDGIFTVTVRELRENVLPDVDDDLAKDAGAESLEALKKKIRDDLEKEGREMSENKLREDAVMALADKNPIAVPPSLVENAVTTIAREMAQLLRLRSEAFNAEEILKTARETAEKRVRAGLLLAELAAKNSLNVTEQDLNDRIEEMAKETGKAAARLRVEYRDEKKRETLANQVLEDKVLKLLLSKVSVKEVPAQGKVHEHDH